MEIARLHAAELALMAGALAFSALFSGSESALFSLKREQIRGMESLPGLIPRAIARLLQSPTALLTSLLLGNTFVNVFYFALSYRLATQLSKETSRATAAVFGGASFMALLVLAEVTPKGIAVRRPLAFSKVVAVAIWGFTRLTSPLAKGFVWFSEKISWMLPVRPEDQTYLTTDELKMLVERSEEHGAIDRGARRMITGIVELGNRMVKDVMVPRVDVTMFNLDEPNEALMDVVRRTQHKRFPAYDGSMDNIRGMVRAADLFLYPDTPAREMLQPVPFVPETKTIDSTLKMFREQGLQAAIAVDEYGGTAGLITAEDVLEEVVGEIEDEFDREEEVVSRAGPDVYVLSGDLRTRAWQDFFDMDLGSPNVETIGGLVGTLLGRVPAEGDTVSYGGLMLTVERMRGHRVEKIRVQLPPGQSHDGQVGRG